MGLNVEGINVNSDTFEITMNNVSIKKLVEVICKLEEKLMCRVRNSIKV